MFQFRRFPSYAYFVQRRMTGYCPAGLPHSDIPGSMDICSSPRLFAACHVLLRLLMPRHSPCALSSLTCSSQSPLRFVSALAKTPPAPLLLAFRRKRVFGDRGREFRSCSELSENSWFSLRIMQAYKDRNCMSPCILSDAVPQSICFLCVSTEKPLCCLTCFCHIVQFSRCRSPSASFRLSPAQLPTAFAVRFEDPIFRSGLQIQRQIAWWARVGSNHRPYDYQSYALAS